VSEQHLARLAPRHVECKFLKMNAEKAPFFVEKLAVRVLPTVVCFRDGVAFPARVLGFDGLSDASDEQQELDAFGSRAAHRLAAGSDSFPTAAVRPLLSPFCPSCCLCWAGGRSHRSVEHVARAQAGGYRRYL
jgi:hypothetical protein